MATNERRRRLASSDYLSPDSDLEEWLARHELIKAVKRVLPEFLERLSADVFPAYQRLAAEDNKFRTRRRSTNTGKLFPRIWGSANAWNVLPKNCELRTSLWEWSTKFNAQDPKFLDETLRTLRSWHDNADWRKNLRWHAVHGGRRKRAIGEGFAFECDAWDLTLSSWKEYSAWVRRRFAAALSDYGTKRRMLAAESNPPLIPARREYSELNLEWFVQYQFAGMSRQEIVEGVTETTLNLIDDSTVSKGIKAAAKLIGWTCLRRISRKTQETAQFS